MSRLSLLALTLPMIAWNGASTPPNSGDIEVHLRRQVTDPAAPGGFLTREETTWWDPSKTALILCDLWDHHWCQGASARVAEMAPTVNEVVKAARERGVLIIHCPSDTMKFYEGTPQRLLAQSAPKVEPLVPLQRSCRLIESREGKLPIDDSDGGCDDEPKCPEGRPWTRQIATIEVAEGDAVTDSEEAYYLLRHRGITNVIVLGVHTNMCVLARPFAIRQLAQQGLNVALMRDLTDTMYNSRMSPKVPHHDGTRLVISHIERHWCPTLTSSDFLARPPFQFADDRAAR